MKKRYLILFSLSILQACSEPPTGEPNYTDEYTISKNYQTVLSVKNSTGRELKRARMLLYIPVEKASSQKMTKLTIDKPYKLSKDGVGNQLVNIDYENLAVDYEESIHLSFEMQLASDLNVLQEGDVGNGLITRLDLPEDEKALFDKLLKEVQGQDNINKLQVLSASLKNNMTLLDRQEAIHQYGESNNEASLQRKIGIVSLVDKKATLRGQSNLLLAMLRASDVTARWVLGISSQGTTQLKQADAQLWIQYREQGRWHLFDVNAGQEIKEYTDKIIFRIIPDLIEQEFTAPEQLLYEGVGVNKV
ncbi:MAG: hypothetical protein GQ583_12575 [Methyloprofundus sp.]|nr:hypothetical protein [Methyloprofundus sp.]